MQVLSKIKGIFTPSNGGTNPLKKRLIDAPGNYILDMKKGYTSKLNEVYSKYKTLFVERAAAQMCLSPDDQLCAAIAEESYKNPETRNLALNEYILQKKYNEKTYCVYINENKKTCVIGFRGTVATDLKDIASDSQIILDIQGIDPRVKEAFDLYDAIKREKQGYSIRVCGHSLGGTISYIVAKHRIPERCVVFNPGVSLNTFFIQMLEDTFRKSTWTERTYTYKILGDIISTIAFIGHTKMFKVAGSDPLTLHALNNFAKKV